MSMRVIHIPAERSPNVRRAFAEMGVESWQDYLDQKAAGTLRCEATGIVILPGVLSWEQYKERRETWDPQEQAVGLDAIFYAGPQLMMWPSGPTAPVDILALSGRLALEMGGRVRRARGGGIDSAEGGDSTSLCAVDAWRDFRVVFQPITRSRPALILLATDGYPNSFRSEPGFQQAGLDILKALRAEGVSRVRNSLEGWLRDTTRVGSGDDVTLGILYPTRAPSQKKRRVRPHEKKTARRESLS